MSTISFTQLFGNKDNVHLPTFWKFIKFHKFSRGEIASRLWYAFAANYFRQNLGTFHWPILSSNGLMTLNQRKKPIKIIPVTHGDKENGNLDNVLFLTNFPVKKTPAETNNNLLTHHKIHKSGWLITDIQPDFQPKQDTLASCTFWRFGKLGYFLLFFCRTSR